MRTFSYEGVGSDGSMLEHNKTYLARFNGAPDKTGTPRETPDSEFMEYRACKNGNLFSMQRGTPHKDFWYHLPQYFDFV